MKIHNNRIEELLHKYTFDELSDSDKDHVLSEMSAHEYNHQHKIIQVVKQESPITELSLPPNIKSSIKKNLKNKWHRPKTLATMLAPLLWISLGALLMYFIWKPNKSYPTQEPTSIPTTPSIDTVYVELRDTIIREIESPPIVQIKEVIKYKEVLVEGPSKAAPIRSISSQAKHVDSKSIEPSTKVSFTEVSTSESISNEEELMNLLTPIPADRLEK